MSHEEGAVWIELNDVRCTVLSCSPHDVETLALGWLLSEGWIASPARVSRITKQDGPNGSTGVVVQADDARIGAVQSLNRHQVTHGCGLRHFLDCAPDVLPRLRAGRAEIDSVHLLRALFAAAESDGERGGIHAVALSDGSQLLTVSYDVARHSATDRAIGSGLRSGIELSTAGLVSTARISAAMTLKAVRCGIGWIASRSIATTLAAEIAAHHGVTLIERAGARHRT